MNSKNIKVIDENNIDRNANIMFGFDLEGSEYVTYWIERDEESNNVFVSKVVKNVDNTFNLANIEIPEEKEDVSKIVKDLISKSVSDEGEKLVGDSLVLDGGKNIKFIAVSFNKEQNFNVKKTYITTVKKEVTRVTEKYYDVVVEPVTNTYDGGISVAPVVPEQKEEIIQDIFPEVAVTNAPSEVQNNNVVSNVDDQFVAFGTEPTVVNTAPVVPEPLMAQPAVVEPITSSQPVSDTVVSPAPVIPEPVKVEPTVEVAPVVPAPVVEAPSAPVETPAVPANEPLVFNASKETNLNAALGEVANSTSIPVENIEPVREFGVDEPVQPVTPVTADPIIAAAEKVQNAQPVNSVPNATPEVPTSPKAGFANNKFFMVVAIAFFLASCVFLGYEVFNYFQLTK